MPPDVRKGAWRFETLWRLPTHIVAFTSLADQSNLLDELDSAFIRDVVPRTTFPMHTINVEIKYKLSDLEIALNSPPNQLPVTGYIQSERHQKISSSTLLRWLQANWSPVDGQLVRDDAYQQWSRLDPTYRHAQVHGKPAVATRGPGRNKVCVCPNTPSLDSLIGPRCSVRFVSTPIFASDRQLACHLCLTFRTHARPLPQRIGDRPRPPRKSARRRPPETWARRAARRRPLRRRRRPPLHRLGPAAAPDNAPRSRLRRCALFVPTRARAHPCATSRPPAPTTAARVRAACANRTPAPPPPPPPPLLEF
jgi:hypothetical protein